ncbi:MAG: ribonuclease III [Phyllobacteriaceae bacterium]|nr:ribonuclease III [Phyllobacteriaceae bacterium]
MARKAGFDRVAEALAALTGHDFRQTDNLRRALTHASARNDAGADYERLEFLGDRVLGLIAADMLVARHPQADQGELALRYNALVNAETLAGVADELGLAEFVQTGAEISLASARKLINLRADIVEALIAAVYLDGGLEPARRFIERYWGKRADAEPEARRDPKTALQEWAHRAAGASPVYEIVAREGPDHAPLFRVRVTVAALAPAEAEGRSRRAAEQFAAAALLARETKEDMP